MSRHTVYRDNDIQVVVGFDRPLQEMFCQWLWKEKNNPCEGCRLDAPMIGNSRHGEPKPMKCIAKEGEEIELDDSVDISIQGQPIEIVLADIWDTVRQHGSVSTAIMDSVTRLLIKEMCINTMDECNRVVDWTKQIPTEGI